MSVPRTFSYHGIHGSLLNPLWYFAYKNVIINCDLHMNKGFNADKLQGKRGTELTLYTSLKYLPKKYSKNKTK
jgi:hypothetical protein